MKKNISDEILAIWLEDLNDDIDRYSDKIESFLWKILWILLATEIGVYTWKYFNG